MVKLFCMTQKMSIYHWTYTKYIYKIYTFTVILYTFGDFGQLLDFG